MEEESERTPCLAWLVDPWEQSSKQGDFWGRRVGGMCQGWFVFEEGACLVRALPSPPSLGLFDSQKGL